MPAPNPWMIAGLVFCAGLSACATRGGPIPYDRPGFGAPDALVAIPVTSSNKIGPSDVIAVGVFGVPEYSGEYAVDELGRVQLPLIGNLTIIGRTPDEAAQDIAAALERTYLRNPRVQVQLKAAASQRITIDGSVSAPGVYPIPGRTTLLQAVALAHGTSEYANPRRTVIFRTINGERMAAAFDLADIRRGIGKDPEIFANDIIIIDGKKNTKLLQTTLSTIPLIGLFTRF